MLTSQRPVANCHSQIRDSTPADGILDRIIHRARRIELCGEVDHWVEWGTSPVDRSRLN